MGVVPDVLLDSVLPVPLAICESFDLPPDMPHKHMRGGRFEPPKLIWFSRQAVSVYMVTSMLIGAGQAYAFTHPAVQRLLRIPQIPGHKPTPVSFKQWLLDWGLKRRNPRQMM